MIPVPGPVASPPNGMVLLPDLESVISMVFTAFWMQHLIFACLHRFGWRTSYFHGMYSILDAKPTYIGTKEYSYITSLYIYTYLYTYIHIYIHSRNVTTPIPPLYSLVVVHHAVAIRPTLQCNVAMYIVGSIIP